MKLRQSGATEDEIEVAMKNLGITRAKKYGWPNTYVFTKAMGEMLVEQLKGNLAVVIVRPAIVTSTFKEPFPGWDEGVRTIDSLALAYGKGKLTCFLGDPKAIVDAYFQGTYRDLKRKIKIVMRLVELYKPYLFFKGVFDDTNTEKLRVAASEGGVETDLFYFDPKVIDWDDYFLNIHLPGLLKYVSK